MFLPILIIIPVISYCWIYYYQLKTETHIHQYIPYHNSLNRKCQILVGYSVYIYNYIYIYKYIIVYYPVDHISHIYIYTSHQIKIPELCILIYNCIILYYIILYHIILYPTKQIYIYIYQTASLSFRISRWRRQHARHSRSKVALAHGIEGPLRAWSNGDWLGMDVRSDVLITGQLGCVKRAYILQESFTICYMDILGYFGILGICWGYLNYFKLFWICSAGQREKPLAATTTQKPENQELVSNYW